MDGSDQDKSCSELSDSWMVVNDPPTDQERDHGGPSDGSDGESVEVIDQEDYDEVLVREPDHDDTTMPEEEELTLARNKQYVHQPNKDINEALNMLMVIAVSIVIGLAVGHYLGYAEELNDMGTQMKKLEAENSKLKNHICMIFERNQKHLEHATGNSYPELQESTDTYAIFLTILLNIKCPILQTKVADVQMSLDELQNAHVKGLLSDDELRGNVSKILDGKSMIQKESKYINAEKLLHKSAAEKNGGEKSSDSANLRKQHDNIKKFVEKHTHDGKPTKYDKKMPYNKQSKKKYFTQKDANDSKYVKSNLYSDETDEFKMKHKDKYHYSKKLKESYHEHSKTLKRIYHQKQQKQSEGEENDGRNKKFYNSHRWEHNEINHRRSNVSGEWVLNLSRGRAECRAHEHKSDWLFDRATARKTKRRGKRDTDNWYFQQAENQKHSRQKSCNGNSKIPYPRTENSEGEPRDKNTKNHNKRRKYFNPKKWISKAYLTISKFFES